MRIITVCLFLISLAGAGCDLRVDTEPKKMLSEGISYDDANYQQRFKQALSKAAIPYEVVVEHNKETIYWDSSYSAAVVNAQDSLDLPPGRNVRLDEPRLVRFKVWLDKRRIPYETVNIDGRKYITWAKADTKRVKMWEEFPSNN